MSGFFFVKYPVLGMELISLLLRLGFKIPLWSKIIKDLGKR